MSAWHTWHDVRVELGNALGSADEQVQRRDQLRREVAVRRLVELRKRAGLRQVDVAERMGVSKARVSHIEHSAVATVDLLARYLDAIGGRLEITAAFRWWRGADCPRLARGVKPLAHVHQRTRVTAASSYSSRAWSGGWRPTTSSIRSRHSSVR